MTQLIHASESCHYYKSDGTPVYTVIGKNGKERPTKITDARENGWYPSYSTIADIAAKPGLERWKQAQIILAALTLPRLEKETEDEFAQRVIEDSKQHGKQASDLGTEIHAAIQAEFEGRLYDSKYAVYVAATLEAMHSDFPGASWICEQTFAHPLGFGGKVDFHDPKLGIVGDWKTTSFDEKSISKLGYDEHLEQLAAYAFGLQIEKARLANVYISTSVPGLVHIHHWSEEERLRGLKTFLAFFEAWKLRRRYNPGSVYISNYSKQLANTRLREKGE